MGDIGSFSTTTITGIQNIAISGVNHLGDPVTQQAKTDLGVAFADTAGRTPNAIFTPIFDLGGLELIGRALAQNGAVTLDYNTIVIPETSSSMLLGFGILLSAARRNRTASKGCLRMI